MPKEHKKRGRREEKKRKREAEEQEEADDTKRRKLSAHEAEGGQDDAQGDVVMTVPTPGEMPFYGMLDEEEQEYFKRADEMLELNQFSSPEERSLFLENVYKEADGKELKIANSQSCSRLMERLILLSTPAQLKELFQKFSGQFLSLVQHRFASHCCEALFIHAAPAVTQEMRALPESVDRTDPDKVHVTMEELFLYTINELEGNLGYLMTDRFASHTLRVLLAVLSGLPLVQPGARSLLRSKKKEKIGINGLDKGAGYNLEKREVPESFTNAMENLISKSVSDLDTTYLRALATHKTGNPTLQLLIQLELSRFGKQRAKDEDSIVRRLLPDDPIVEGTESAKFIQAMIYDPVGSHLVETIVEHAPGKLFKQLYREFFKDRVGSLARNDIAGYVVCKVLERLSKEDLAEARDQIITQIPNLAERNRTLVIRTLIERCDVRGVDTLPLASVMEQVYGGPHGFEVTRLLRVNEVGSTEWNEPNHPEDAAHHHDSSKVHSSLLAQAMLNSPGPLSTLIFTSLLSLPPPLLLKLSLAQPTSQVLQSALNAPEASTIFRRKIIQSFYGQISSMALDPYASHVIDAIWNGTSGLAFIRERIAEELAENEASLRESKAGRVVWRNWHMDLYKRRRGEWVKMCRNSAGNEGFMSFPNDRRDSAGEGEEGGKSKEKEGNRHSSAIEAARQKHFKRKERREKAAKRARKSKSSSNGTSSKENFKGKAVAR